MKYTLYYSVIRDGKHYRLFACTDEKWKTIKFNSIEEAKVHMVKVLENIKYNKATYDREKDIEGVTFKIKNSDKEYVFEETVEM